MLIGWAPAANACQGAAVPPGSQSADSTRIAITCLINHLRRQHGLRAIRGDFALATAAQRHSDSMTSENFFAHDGSDGTPRSRAAAAGYISAHSKGWSVGETLGFGSGGLGSPRAIVQAWKASPVHRYVMLLRRWRQIGIGISAGSPMGADRPSMATYTVDFGHR
jgi:uncharacterized protein YkwD